MKKRIIFSAVICCELLAVFYFLPRKGSGRAFSFEKALSAVCLNAEDLFTAQKRCLLLKQWFFNVDERVLMYYVDIMPKKNKRYDIRFNPVPVDLEPFYDLYTMNGEKVYVLKGLPWDQLKEKYSSVLKEYYQGPETYVVYKR